MGISEAFCIFCKKRETKKNLKLGARYKWVEVELSSKLRKFVQNEHSKTDHLFEALSRPCNGKVLWNHANGTVLVPLGSSRRQLVKLLLILNQQIQIMWIHQVVDLWEYHNYQETKWHWELDQSKRKSACLDLTVQEQDSLDQIVTQQE